MSYIKAGTDASGRDIKLFYQDLGSPNANQTIVLIHGWPLSHEMWDYQLAELPAHGFRVVAYDRRGFGKSSQTWDGYDYDTLSDDLKAVLDTLDLHNVTLVGFSMGGGEVARYMGRHGGKRVTKVAFVSSVTPYMLKTDDNPDGVDQSVFQEIYDGLQKDRADFLQTFGKQFYGNGLLSSPASDGQLQGDFNRAYVASQKATLDTAHSFAETDFRNDLAQIHVPTLIIHGDSDKTVPIEASAERTAQLVPNSQFITYEGDAHGLFYLQKDRLTQDLVSFVQDGVPVQERMGTTTIY